MTTSTLRPAYTIEKQITDDADETIYVVLDEAGDEIGSGDTRAEAKELLTELADDAERSNLIDAIDLDSLDLVTLRKVMALIGK